MGAGFIRGVGRRWPPWCRIPYGLISSKRTLALALLSALPLVMALAVPVVRYGDASDYAMMTMSLVHDADLVYEPKDLARVLASRPEGTDYPAGMFLIRDGRGRLHVGGHSFYYPLVAALGYAACGYRGFALTNALLLIAVVVLVAWHFPPERRLQGWAWGGLAISFSAALDYTIWPMAETWLLFLSAAFLSAFKARRVTVAGALLGAAAASQLSMLMWGIVPLVALLSRRLSLGQAVRLSLAALMVALPQFAYNYVITGHPHPALMGLADRARYLYYPLAFPGETHFSRASHAVVFTRFSRPQHLSASDIASALFSPRMGLLWFYPLTALAAVRMWRERSGGLALAAAALVLVAFCTAGDLVSHQVGLRYLNPIYPAFLLGFRGFKWDKLERGLLILGVVLGLTFVLFPRANSQELFAFKAVPWVTFSR